MDPELKWAAGIAAVSIVGLISSLTAVEAFDAGWLIVPVIGFLFAAIVASSIAVLGVRGTAISFALIAAVVLVAFLAEALD